MRESLSSLKRANVCSLQEWIRSVWDCEFVSMGGKEKELIVADSGLLKHKDRGQKERGVNSGSLTGSCQA